MPIAKIRGRCRRLFEAVMEVLGSVNPLNYEAPANPGNTLLCLARKDREHGRKEAPVVSLTQRTSPAQAIWASPPSGSMSVFHRKG